MTTAASTTKGILLQRGDGGGTEVFTTIGEVTNFNAPNETMETLDATSFDSASKEFIVSKLTDGGEVTFEMNWVGNDAQQQGLRTDLRAGTLRNFKITLADASVSPTVCAFSGYVTAAPNPNGGVGAVVKASCTIKVSGLPTWTYTA